MPGHSSLKGPEMVKRASLKMKNSRSYDSIDACLYPFYYRFSILENLQASRNVLGLLSLLGFCPGVLRIARPLNSPQVLIFGTLPDSPPYRRRPFKRRRAKLRRFRGRSTVAVSPDIAPARTLISLSSCYKLGVRALSGSLLLSFLPSVVLLWFRHAFNVRRRCLIKNRRRKRLRFFSKIKKKKKRQRRSARVFFLRFFRRRGFKFLFKRLAFRFRTEYALSYRSLANVRLFLCDYGFLRFFSRHFSNTSLLPMRKFWTRFRSLRSRAFLAMFFSGFFFIDFDLATDRLSVGLRQAHHRQHTYVCRLVPELTRFSNYYNTLVRGLRFSFRGKLGGVDRSRFFVVEDFKPQTGFFLQSTDSGVQYRFATSNTYTGAFGLHTFVYLKQRYLPNIFALES